jgi:glycosyltransferase involved in cell wall biosynthesis
VSKRWGEHPSRFAHSETTHGNNVAGPCPPTVNFDLEAFGLNLPPFLNTHTGVNLSVTHDWYARSNADLEPCLSVVMPVYNEASTVREVLKTVLAQRPVQELVIVDDASTDGSWEVLAEVARSDPRAKVFRHERNQGKGAALATGFSQATSPIVMIQDADLEYDPSEYHLLLKPILTNKADVVYGSRFTGSGEHRVLYFWHSVGNKFLTMLSNMTSNLNLSDMETGYKVFRREILKDIRIQEKRFGFEPEITAKVAKLGVRIYEVPISYHGRTYAEGKKVNWKDGFRALWCVVKYNLLK